VIEDLSIKQDLSLRNRTLNILDERRNAGTLPWAVSQKDIVLLSLSAYGLKIVRENDNYSVVARVPLHLIASVTYIKDDPDHFVLLKTGKTQTDQDQYEPLESCMIYVLKCSKQSKAELICNIIEEAFILVYTEATFQSLNNATADLEDNKTAVKNDTITEERPAVVKRDPPALQVDRKDTVSVEIFRESATGSEDIEVIKEVSSEQYSSAVTLLSEAYDKYEVKCIHISRPL
jgi:hypothetical protein